MKRPKRARGETPRSIRAQYLKKNQRRRVVIKGSRLPPPLLIYRGKLVWELDQPYVYAPEGFTIPKGFKTDLASVPKLLWWLISPFDLSIVAPVVHDFIYQTGGKVGGKVVRYDRPGGDAVFLYAMRRENVAAWRRAAAYHAVRVYAASSWRGA